MLKELLPTLLRWIKDRRPFVLVRVIDTWGSSPRPSGAGLAISDTLEMAGSVSGGCVEGAVMKEAETQRGSALGKLLQYGVSDQDAWAVGLSCGGKVDLLMQDFPFGTAEESLWTAWLDALKSNTPCVWITSLAEGMNKNTLMMADGTTTGQMIPQEIYIAAREALQSKKNGLTTADEVRYFIQVFPRRDLLLIIGAAHITADLVHLAKMFDLETVVIDPRGAFTDRTQFTTPPDQLLEAYPIEVLEQFPLDQSTYAVILSHDPKIDDNALHILLRKPVAYIGALGSRKSHEKRTARLKEAGFTEEEIQRIEAPIGMPIQAQGAREIALSIMGSVIRTKNGK